MTTQMNNRVKVVVTEKEDGYFEVTAYGNEQETVVKAVVETFTKISKRRNDVQQQEEQGNTS